MRALLELGDDETLLIQSGKPVAVFRTTTQSPRVLIANSLLVPRWATWEEFRRLEAEGLTMFGQMTAGSWIYIGTQGILQGTYQTFAAAAQEHFGEPSLAGRTILTAGLGGMGGAQPLAATMAGAAILCVEVDPTRIERRLETRYLDEATERSTRRSHGCARRPARGARSRWVCSATRRTSCPSSHGAVSTSTSSRTRPPRTIRSPGTCLGGSASPRPTRCGRPTLTSTCGAPATRSPLTWRQCSRSPTPAAHVFDYGNNLRGEARDAGVAEAFSYPGFVPAYIRPLFCRGIGPFRWAALSGDPDDIAAIDDTLRGLFPGDELLQRWLELAPGESPSRGFRRGSAGSGTATARGRDSRSTTSSRAARWRRRS